MQMLAHFEKNRRIFALAMLVATTLLFAYSVVRWQATAGLDPDLRPVRSVYFFAAVALQATESAVRPRRAALSVAIWLLVIALLVLGSLSPS